MKRFVCGLIALVGLCVVADTAQASCYGQAVVQQNIVVRQRQKVLRQGLLQRHRQKVVIQQQVVAPVYTQAVVAAPVVQQYVVPQQQIVVPYVQQQAIVVPQVQQYVAPLNGCLSGQCSMF